MISDALRQMAISGPAISEHHIIGVEVFANFVQLVATPQMDVLGILFQKQSNMALWRIGLFPPQYDNAAVTRLVNRTAPIKP